VDLLLPMLLSLQKLDDKLSAFDQQKQEIPERIQAMRHAFEEKKKQLEDDQQRLKEAVLKQRQLEKQLQESGEERKKQQKKLLDVKTNAEYKAMLKEIEHAKQADSATEDGILAASSRRSTPSRRHSKRRRSRSGRAKANSRRKHCVSSGRAWRSTKNTRSCRVNGRKSLQNWTRSSLGITRRSDRKGRDKPSSRFRERCARAVTCRCPRRRSMKCSRRARFDIVSIAEGSCTASWKRLPDERLRENQ